MALKEVKGINKKLLNEVKGIIQQIRPDTKVTDSYAVNHVLGFFKNKIN